MLISKVKLLRCGGVSASKRCLTLRYLSTERKVFTWGCGDDGQLGFPEIVKSGLRNTYEELLPKHLPSLDSKKINKLAFGFTHSAAIDGDGKLYTWGSNENKQLGISTDEKMESVKTPTLLEECINLNIVDVACGEFHTAAVDHNGRLYTWGWGGSSFSGNGALGHGNSEHQPLPKLVESLVDEGVAITKVDCGGMHTLALSTEGELWGWGNGEFGRLGDGGNSDQKFPEPVEFFYDMNVVDFAVGHEFSIALTDDGKLYSWGRNEHSQLGLGGGLTMDTYSCENFPKLVESLKNEKIVKIAAGSTQAAVITEDGRLYTWGAKVWIDPHEMTALKDYKIIDVGCGDLYTAALAETGEVFTFGKGKSCCLGQVDRKSRQQPTKIEDIDSVISIACGRRHMGAIVETEAAAADNDFRMRE